MQKNRLFEIVYLLLAKKSVTASELAKHFEVSVRTIYRDIEALSGAGIPIYMCKGKGGGIRLLDDYILNKAVLSEEEQKEIISALQGINAVTGDAGKELVTKLNGMFQRVEEKWVEVDFSDWSGESVQKFEDIKQAILKHIVLEFDYFNRLGEASHRKVQPNQLYFKDKTWYLKAFCLNKNADRLFKLTRMKNVELSNQVFERNETIIQELTQKYNEKDTYTDMVELVFEVDDSVTYRIYDEFPENEIEKLDNGNYRISVLYADDPWIYGMLLSYGSHARVIKPKHVKDRLRQEIELMYRQYTKG